MDEALECAKNLLPDFAEVGIPVVNMGIPVAETFRQKK